MLIRDLYGMAAATPKNYSKVVPQNTPDPLLLYGLELEIENVPNWDDMCVPGMESKADGSLRNNGREFITKPMTFSNLWYCLERFFDKNKLSEANYSERCSIHVHTNVQDLEWEQVQTLALVYQVVERLLFKWIGHDRDSNIFCVPLHQTNITHQRFGQSPAELPFRRWEKYTALNFLPMATLGTVEWRHMNGHCDFTRIMTWCTLIGHIFAYTRNNPYNEVKDFIVSLNTTSAYEHFLGMVFGANMREFQGMQAELEDGVLDVKYSLFDNKQAKPKSSFFTALGDQFVTFAAAAPAYVVMDDIEAPPVAAAPIQPQEVQDFIRREQQRIRETRAAGLQPIRRRTL